MIGFDAYRRPGTIDYQLAAVCVRHFLGVIDRICTGTATLYYPSSVSYDPDSNTEAMGCFIFQLPKSALNHFFFAAYHCLPPVLITTFLLILTCQFRIVQSKQVQGRPFASTIDPLIPCDLFS